jgi:hypothetical protein
MSNNWDFDAARVTRTANPFREITKEPWLARLRENGKWKFYCEQFRLATIRQIETRHGN